MGKGGGGGGVEETAQEKALSEVAMDQWKAYATRYQPAENKFLKDITGVDVTTGKVVDDFATKADKVVGQTNADLAAETSAGYRSMPSAGVNPNSGKFKAVMGGLSKRQGEAGGQALSSARQGVEDLRLKGMQTAVSMGRGQATEAQLGMESVASDSVSKAITNTRSKLAERDALGRTVGTVAGIGAGLYSRGLGTPSTASAAASRADDFFS